MQPSIDLGSCLAPASWAPDLFTWSAMGLSGVMLTLTTVLGAARNFPGRPWLLGVQVCAAIWLVLSALESSTGHTLCQSTLMQLQRPLMMGVPALWLAFVVQYGSSNLASLPRWCLSISVAPWLLLSACALTNGWHGLFFGSLEKEHGLWRFAPALLTPIARAWVYLVLGVAVAALAWRLWHSTANDRWRWGGFLVACLLPWSVTIGHQVAGWHVEGHDPTPLAMLSYCLALGSLSWTRRAFDLAPHARNLLFSENEDPMLVVDHAGYIIEVNRACCRLGVPGLAAGQPLSRWEPWGLTILGHTASRAGPILLSADDGRQHYELQVRWVCIGTEVAGQLVHLHDVSDLVRTRAALADALCRRERELESIRSRQAELIEASLQDPLTGLHNRRALEQRFAEEAAHAHKTGKPLSLVMIDLDCFKKVNDTFGHAAGDDVLKALSGHLVHGVRSTDTVFRIGGEEFVILLPAADGEQALARADHLRRGFRSVQTGSGATVKVTFSGGVAQWDPMQPGLGTLLAMADGSLYGAKAGGRDRIELSAAADRVEPAESPA